MEVLYVFKGGLLHYSDQRCNGQYAAKIIQATDNKFTSRKHVCGWQPSMSLHIVIILNTSTIIASLLDKYTQKLQGLVLLCLCSSIILEMVAFASGF